MLISCKTVGTTLVGELFDQFHYHKMSTLYYLYQLNNIINV